ncbi:hypothetical protein EDB85DRAFT_1891577 [Lactarius pseudohatsudake]|nr:hypothetical protein EDB85DRAFT_1891577 [Lactarius pseudohatsudake]
MRQEELHGPARISNTSLRREIRAGRMGADDQGQDQGPEDEEETMIKLSLKPPLPWYFPEVKLKEQERKDRAMETKDDSWQETDGPEGEHGEETVEVGARRWPKGKRENGAIEKAAREGVGDTAGRVRC